MTVSSRTRKHTLSGDVTKRSSRFRRSVPLLLAPPDLHPGEPRDNKPRSTANSTGLSTG